MMLFVVRCSLFVPVLNSTILQFFSRHGGQGFPLLQLSPYPFYLLRSTFYFKTLVCSEQRRPD